MRLIHLFILLFPCIILAGKGGGSTDFDIVTESIQPISSYTCTSVSPNAFVVGDCIQFRGLLEFEYTGSRNINRFDWLDITWNFNGSTALSTERTNFTGGQTPVATGTDPNDTQVTVITSGKSYRIEVSTLLRTNDCINFNTIGNETINLEYNLRMDFSGRGGSNQEVGGNYNYTTNIISSCCTANPGTWDP